MASTSRGISVVSEDSLMYPGNTAEEDSSTTSKEDSVDNEIFQANFYKKLVEYDDNHSGSNRKPWTREKILEMITDLKNIRVSAKKKSLDYYRMGKYDVVTTETEEYLIVKKKHPIEPTVRIVPREQYFEILSEVHASCGHGGRDKMLQDIKNKIYIPKKAVEIFVSLCPVCETKRGGHKNEIVTRTVSHHFNEKGRFELIDFRSCPDGEYKWLLNYQNTVTKFTILRPLKSKGISEISSELLTIFLTLGAPYTLQSELGSEFVTIILKQLAAIWPECEIINEPENSIDQSYKDVERTMRSWMHENNSTNWTIGCLFVQYYKNTSFNHALGKFPYEALFGRVPKGGLNVSYIPASSLSAVKIEEPTSAQPEQEPVNIKLEVEVEDHSPAQPMNTENEVIVEQKFKRPSEYENEATDAYKCKACNSAVHIICGVIEDDQGQRLKVSCYVCNSVQDMELIRNKARKRAAEETTDDTPNKIPTLGIGCSVIVAVPKELRGPLKTKSIKGKIVDLRNGVYRVGTKIGTIKNWFSRQDLQYNGTDYGEVSNVSVSLEEAIASQPNSDSPVNQKCTCKPAVNQCHNNRCVCFKNKVLCGPKCHQKLACVNT